MSNLPVSLFSRITDLNKPMEVRPSDLIKYMCKEHGWSLSIQDQEIVMEKDKRRFSIPSATVWDILNVLNDYGSDRPKATTVSKPAEWSESDQGSDSDPVSGESV